MSYSIRKDLKDELINYAICVGPKSLNIRRQMSQRIVGRGCMVLLNLHEVNPRQIKDLHSIGS